MSRAGLFISNPRTGQRMRFVTTGAETGGRLLQIECYHPAHSRREPEHVHPHQENRFAVHRGTLTFCIERRILRVGPGQRIAVPPGTPHSFWNDSDEPAEYLQEFAPAKRIDAFFESIFVLAGTGRLRADGQPAFLQLAVLMDGFADEFRVTKVSPLLQRLIRLSAPVGRLLGYRDEYRSSQRPARSTNGIPPDGESDKSATPPRGP